MKVKEKRGEAEKGILAAIIAIARVETFEEVPLVEASIQIYSEVIAAKVTIALFEEAIVNTANIPTCFVATEVAAAINIPTVIVEATGEMNMIHAPLPRNHHTEAKDTTRVAENTARGAVGEEAGRKDDITMTDVEVIRRVPTQGPQPPRVNDPSSRKDLRPQRILERHI